MPRRIAATMSLLAFAVCVVLGLAADNPITTTLYRALLAMGGTLVIGLVIGAMAQRMIDEHVDSQRKRAAEKSEVSADNSTASGR